MAPDHARYQDDPRLQAVIREWEQNPDRDIDDLCRDCPELRDAAAGLIAELSSFDGEFGDMARDASNQASRSVHEWSTIKSDAGISEADPRSPVPTSFPSQIGRYRVHKTLGRGGFGTVYLATDDELKRSVAIKVPHVHLISTPEDVTAYLTEAQILASLDHLGIVPVYDFGRTDDGLCYVVSKFIEGTSLDKRIAEDRPSHVWSAETVAAIAEALHYSHARRLVHRDIKPANIVIAADGRPHLLDFGIALKEEDFGQDRGIIGTPAYMSPEQARGEGHLVDGRSDIFSLGVVFYELLTGVRPFSGKDWEEIAERIKTHDIRPPRQLADFPSELERICMKALSKRAADRYTTAKDMSDDLQSFLAGSTPDSAAASSAAEGRPTPRLVGDEPIGHVTPTTTPSGLESVDDLRRLPNTSTAALAALQAELSEQSQKVVPKGLRPFDAEDADFFLQLLPGPRGRDGLPDSIRFWKARVEKTDVDETFRMGLIYGPSGCGKSSLVRAGLLPNLSPDILPIYVECAAEDTEARLLRGIRKKIPRAPAYDSLIELMATIRRRSELTHGKKVLIVLDQFEQWLQAHRDKENAELAQALRHCDGGRLQCIALVRDDFWMAATRFFHELDVRLLDGENCAPADLFDLLHGREVLIDFGRSYGRLPESLDDLTEDQEMFLDRAISGLAEDGKIVCVRLALFAEMVKGRPWTIKTLQDIGGFEGVGVAFLEETFSTNTAPPEHRLHQNAARSVLRSLLPDSGSRIKGGMRPRNELLTLSGYANRPVEFEHLLQILDSELRLLTPIDPAGALHDENSASQVPPGERYYQLTHDYIVPSLRSWLSRKQRETRRGRAELSLAERAAQWTAQRQNRHLPSWSEAIRFILLTQRKYWSSAERGLMREASRYYTKRAIIITAVCLLVAWVSIEFFGRSRASDRVRALASSDTTEVMDRIKDLKPYRRWARPLLEKIAATSSDPREKLHASLALLEDDSNPTESVIDQLLMAAPRHLKPLCAALESHQPLVVEAMWKALDNVNLEEERRFRAGCTLAYFGQLQEDHRFSDAHQLFLASQLVGRYNPYEPSQFEAWAELLGPVHRLRGALAGILRSNEQPAKRIAAVKILVQYFGTSPNVLTNVLLDADHADPLFPELFGLLVSEFDQNKPSAVRSLRMEVDKVMDADARVEERLRHAKRKAKAAAALLKLGDSEGIYELLVEAVDVNTRSYLIHFISEFGIDSEAIVKRLRTESDSSVRRALLLALGASDISVPRRQLLSKQLNLIEVCRSEEDPGLRAAAEWLLRTWGQEPDLKNARQRQWYVNSAGHCMVLIDAHRLFLMGSPDEEVGQEGDESQHDVEIDRTFSIASKETTFQQFLRFRPDYAKLAQNPLAPVTNVMWYQAAAYCNWLSNLEGISRDQWCYLRNEEGEFADGMKLAEDYLSRTGYRLPTEAEWEYACRAGSTTARYFGDANELLPQYGWYRDNSEGQPHPVALLRPNSLGLFDMHGNVLEWCQGTYETRTRQDVAGDLSVGDGTPRVLRGGQYDDHSSHVRSAWRGRLRPNFRAPQLGFRVARTHTPGDEAQP